MKAVTIPTTTIDHAATGAAARKERIALGVSIREMAHRIGWSAAYLSDLEKGRRCWTDRKVDCFNGACWEEAK
jgi:predicted transcriptional regulator